MSAGVPFDYEAATWGADAIRPGDRSIAAFRLDELLRMLPERGRVLEVGCGAGRFLRAIVKLRPELELVGCDVSRSSLEVLGELAPEIERRVVSGSELPAADEEFDAILVVDVLEHVEEPGSLLSAIRRALKPEGLFHLHVPCEADALCLWRWLPGQDGEAGLKRKLGGHIQRFRRRDILDLLTEVGFEPLRVRNSLHLLGNLADVAAFVRLEREQRSSGTRRTTGDLVAGGGALIRAVDGLLWAEATLLSRLPSWSIHVWSRKVSPR